MDKKMDRLRNFVFILNIAVMIIVCLFGFSEIAFRILDLSPPVVVEKSGARQIDLAGLLPTMEERLESGAYDDYSWAADFVRVHKEAWANAKKPLGYRYEPFSLWKAYPFRHKYVTFEENGYRRTINPPAQGKGKPFRVFILGGSVIAGAGIIRDEDTVPSLIAKKLNAALPDRTVHVHNYGQGGFNSDNSMVLLTRLLTDPTVEKPDFVVFYHGPNDLLHKVLFGVPHMAFRRFDTNIPVTPREPDFIERVAMSLRWRSAVVRYFLGPPPRPVMDENPGGGVYRDKAEMRDRIASVVARRKGHYAMLSALAAYYGFDFLMVLPPTALTKKNLSAVETKTLERVRKKAPEILETLVDGYAAIKAAFVDTGAYGNHFDASGVMGDVAKTTYADWVHVTPLGNELIAKRLGHLIVTRIGTHR